MQFPRYRYALIDCDNFYCSCERIFNPKLAGRPLVILSSDDGCIIARSQEAKAIGIPMGAPVFSVRHIMLRHKVHACSANFSLYADISARVMQVLKQHTSYFEMYSIDEAFLMLEDAVCQRVYLEGIREQVLKWAGVPISIGLGATKTLAKIATYIAKQDPVLKGIFDLTREPEETINCKLRAISTEAIWGVGRRFAQKLKARHIHTIYDFKHAEGMHVRNILGVVGQRIFYELNGQDCICLEEMSSCKKHISTARSLAHPIREKSVLQSILADYIARISVKLRAQGCVACGLQVGLSTNRFEEKSLQYHPSAHASLVSPSDYTADFITLGKALFESIYKPQYSFKKVKAMLYGIIPRKQAGMAIFDNSNIISKKESLMKAIDHLNRGLDKPLVCLGAMSLGEDLFGKSSLRSPSYTTCWDDLLKIH